MKYSGSKLVAHNYGHGGSGWTMAPGAASYVTRELANRMTSKGYTNEEPICIVGAGVMGKQRSVWTIYRNTAGPPHSGPPKMSQMLNVTRNFSGKTRSVGYKIGFFPFLPIYVA